MQEVFGHTSEGETVHRVELRGGGLTASIMTWGAALQDLRLDGHPHPLVLGFPRFEDYPTHSPYFGATAGRYANRIAEGRFRLDGIGYQLDCNQAGRHHLHGGSEGIGTRIWRIANRGDDFIRLEIEDPDGHMGYPGDCRIACTYRLHEEGTFAVRLEAETDRPTICNLAHHSYFNLDGSQDVLDHEIRILADHYIPVDDDQIPVGDILGVTGTPFDLRESRAIRSPEETGQLLYDHNFCLSDTRTGKRAVAWVRSPNSGISLEVQTGEPGLQFYCGFKVNTPVPGLTGKPYGAFSGLCLESQVWPDSPNHDQFTDAVLRPGTTLVQETDYIFSHGG
jgi:aldose 1-epimerase